MKRIIILVAALTAMLWMATGEAGAGNVYVSEKPTLPAAYPGNVEGIERFVTRHFKYPLAAWKEQQWVSVTLDAVIRYNGRVGDFEVISETEPHPMLVGEIGRVLEKMTWFPAYDEKGDPVNSRQRFSFPLKHEIYDYNYQVPIGREDEFRDNASAVRKLGRSAADMKPAEIERTVDLLCESTETYYDYPPFIIAYVRMLNSIGRNASADTIVGNYLREYQDTGFRNFINMKGDTVSMDVSATFSGRVEMWLAILSALTNPGNEDAYMNASGMVELRMLDNRLYSYMQAHSKREKDKARMRMTQMKRDVVNEWARGYLEIGRGTQAYDRITRFRSVDEMNRGLSAWSVEMNNAPMSMMVERIHQEMDDMIHGKKATSRDQINLFGVKAMLTLLMEGDGAMRQYIAGIKDSGPSKKLHSYLEKLEKRYEANAPLLADRDGALQAVACLLPPDGTDPTTFYARRKALEEVFPLQWLME